MNRFLLMSAILLLPLPVFAESPIGDEASKLVKIMVYDTKSKEYISSGSGVRINPHGDILTNLHVVEGALNPFLSVMLIVCTVDDDRSPPMCDFKADLERHNTNLDLALLKVTDHLGAPTRKEMYPVKSRKKTPIDEYYQNTEINALPYFEFDRTDYDNIPETGEEMHVLGFPGAASDYITYTKGSVSGFEHAETRLGEKVIYYYRTDALLRPGNSGGAALNNRLEFVGLPSAGNINDEFTGYVIAMPYILSFLDEAGESNSRFCDTPVDGKERDCSCNPGMEYVSSPRKSTYGSCVNSEPVDCGVNAKLYNGTAAKNDCICDDGFEWQTYGRDVHYCSVIQAAFFPVHDHGRFGYNEWEDLGTQIRLRSGLLRQEQQAWADLSWEIIDEDFEDIVTRFKMMVFLEDHFRLRYKDDIHLSRESNDPSLRFAVEPGQTYYIEILGANERDDDILVLRFTFTVADDISRYPEFVPVDDDEDSAEVQQDDQPSYQQLAKQKRLRFVDMIVVQKKECNALHADPDVSRECFREGFKLKLLEFIRQKREYKKQCRESFTDAAEREYCVLQRLVSG